MKSISFLLIFLILLQSCSVYHEPTSVEAAVIADKKVRIITTDKKKYKFIRVENKDNRLIGITKLNSSTARKLAGRPAIIEDKYLEVDISDVDIKNIRLRNNAGSTGLTVAAIGASLLVAFYAIFLISFASDDLFE